MLKEEIVKVINDMDVDEIVKLYNKYCNKTMKRHRFIYEMSEFDDVMKDNTPTSIAYRICFGKFNPKDDYFRLEQDGSLTSFVDPDLYINPYHIADYIIKESDCLQNDTISKILKATD